MPWLCFRYLLRKLSAVMAYQQLREINSMSSAISGAFGDSSSDDFISSLVGRVFDQRVNGRQPPPVDWDVIRRMVREHRELTPTAKLEALDRLDELEARSA